MSPSILIVLSSLGWTAGPGPTVREWKVDGVTRQALIYAPPRAGSDGSPVVFAFHGHGGTMRAAARSQPYHEIWPEAIVVYMQGLPTPGIVDPEGRLPGWQKKPGDQADRDLKFFDAVLAGLRADDRVDPRRIYATGYSNGGAFTYLLWARRGDLFAAVAPSASGAGLVSRDLRPLPAMHIAGEKDQLVPFASQQRTMSLVRKLNGADPVGEPWAKSGPLVATRYSSGDGKPFVSVVYPGTHRYPEEAPGLVVRFFKEQVRP